MAYFGTTQGSINVGENECKILRVEEIPNHNSKMGFDIILGFKDTTWERNMRVYLDYETDPQGNVITFRETSDGKKKSDPGINRFLDKIVRWPQLKPIIGIEDSGANAGKLVFQNGEVVRDPYNFISMALSKDDFCYKCWIIKDPKNDKYDKVLGIIHRDAPTSIAASYMSYIDYFVNKLAETTHTTEQEYGNY